jgi:hypothetical protein
VTVGEHLHRHVRGLVLDDQVEPPWHDERAGVQRVRRDERDCHRVEAPDQHGTSVREVVGGRAGRRGADDPVASLPAEILSAHRPLQLDHAPDERARSDDVVDRRLPQAVELDLERRQLDDAIVARKHARQQGFQLVLVDRREEADAAEVDAEGGHRRAEKPLQRP